MQGVCYDSNGIGSIRSCAGRVDRELTEFLPTIDNPLNPKLQQNKPKNMMLLVFSEMQISDQVF